MPVLAPERPHTAPSSDLEQDWCDVSARSRYSQSQLDDFDAPDVNDYDMPPDRGGNDDDDDDRDDDDRWGGDDGPVRWVTVATFWHSTGAHIAKLKLESEDIDCVLFDENLNWLCATCGGGIKLQVPEPDAPRARWILQTRDGDGEAPCPPAAHMLDCAEDEAFVASRANRCPHCGAASGELLPVLRRLGAVAVPLVIAGMIAPASPVVSVLVAAASFLTLVLPRYRCPRCAGEWAVPASADARPERRGFDVIANDVK